MKVAAIRLPSLKDGGGGGGGEERGVSTRHPGSLLPLVTPHPSSPLSPPITHAAGILSKLFCMTFATVALIITITQAL